MIKSFSKLFAFVIFFFCVLSINNYAQQVNGIFAPPGGGGSTTTSTTVESSDNTLLYVAVGAVVVAAVVYAVLKNKNKEDKTPGKKDSSSVQINPGLLKIKSDTENLVHQNLPLQLHLGLKQLSYALEEKQYFLGVRYNF